MCFAKLFYTLLKGYCDILAKTCHFLTGLDFTAAWPLNFTPVIMEKFVSLMHWRKKKQKNNLYCFEQIQHSQTLFLDPWQQFHSRGYGAVNMWPVCSELLRVLICIHYAFIKRTNRPYGLSVFICINSLLYSFPCLSIYPSHSTGSRLLFFFFFFIGYVLNPLAL